jgi:hypothetical protein
VSDELTADEAKALLKLFGGYVHTNDCDYVQKPKAECSCERANLYSKVHEIASQGHEESKCEHCGAKPSIDGMWHKQSCPTL